MSLYLRYVYTYWSNFVVSCLMSTSVKVSGSDVLVLFEIVIQHTDIDLVVML